MPTFRITHANRTTTDVEADSYRLANGYFDFNKYEDEQNVQVMSIRETAVVKIEKVN